MLTTSLSLLRTLQEPNQNPAWERFVDLYTPFLLAWAQRKGLQSSDAADLVQEVFVVLVRKLDAFDPSRGKFRAWLRTVCHNKWRDRMRPKDAQLAQARDADLADLADDADMDEFWNAEHNEYLLRQALLTFQHLRDVLTPKTVDMTIAVLVDGLSAVQVAQRYDVSPNAVRLAKLKVVRRLREEIIDFIS